MIIRQFGNLKNVHRRFGHFLKSNYLTFTVTENPFTVVENSFILVENGFTFG